MGKKNKGTPQAKGGFSSNPFSQLKGLSASASDPQPKPSQPKAGAHSLVDSLPGSFNEEMDLLGVKPLPGKKIDPDSDGPQSLSPAPDRGEQILTDEELFRLAVGELQDGFQDQWQEEESSPRATGRRMRQLKQGKLIPEAKLDLHGLVRDAVADRLRFFLQDARYQGWRTLLVITGKGLHSEDNRPVLRRAAEQFLRGEGRKLVAEWGEAPRQYGGAGALVLFLRKA